MFAGSAVYPTSSDEEGVRRPGAAPGADYVVVNGMHSKGRKGIDEGHAGIFAVIYKVSHNKATIRSVRFIRPDVAIAHVEWNLEFETGGQSHKAHAMNTIVASREQGKWQINAVHNTPIQAAR